MYSSKGLLVYTLLILCVSSCTREGADADNPTAAWPPDHEPTTPQLFLPELVCTGERERDATFTPDGSEFYYTIMLPDRDHSVIAYTELRSGRWVEPRVAPFSGRFPDIEPFISPDGRVLYFASRRPVGDETTLNDWDLWRVRRQGSGWGIPEHLGPEINSEGDEFFPAVTSSGRLYFTTARDGGLGKEDIWMSEITGQGFAKPILLSDAVNSPGWEFNSWVSGEDDLIIFTAFGREDDLGGGDLYFSRRDSLGSWTPAQNLGSPINTTALDYCPMITADGRYFFYTTAQKDYDLFFSPSLDMAGIEAIKNAPRNGLDDIYFIRVTEIPALQEVLNMSISDERADLMEQDRRFAALSAASGPAEAFRQFVHKDATLLTSQYDNVIGREAIFASMSQLPETTTLEWEPQDAGVAESGDMGWSWGRYTSLSLAEDGSEQESVGKYLNVWIRDKDGDWKVLMDLGN